MTVKLFMDGRTSDQLLFGIRFESKVWLYRCGVGRLSVNSSSPLCRNLLVAEDKLIVGNKTL